MTNFISLGLLALWLCVSPLSAQPIPCKGPGCGQLSFELTSASDRAQYGVLVRSPDQIACQSVQFIVSSDDRGIMGRTLPLQAGDVQVVRIGRGFTAGTHDFQIRASGCPVQPEQVRRVRLAKASPDHGWRAVAFLQAQAAL